jgi:hypothetical protein
VAPLAGARFSQTVMNLIPNVVMVEVQGNEVERISLHLVAFPMLAHVLVKSIERLNVICALERRRFCHSTLAHTAPHLFD